MEQLAISNWQLAKPVCRDCFVKAAGREPQQRECEGLSLCVCGKVKPVLSFKLGETNEEQRN
jgi:hypothetical protein